METGSKILVKRGDLVISVKPGDLVEVPSTGEIGLVVSEPYIYPMSFDTLETVTCIDVLWSVGKGKVDVQALLNNSLVVISEAG